MRGGDRERAHQVTAEARRVAGRPIRANHARTLCPTGAGHEPLPDNRRTTNPRENAHVKNGFKAFSAQLAQ
jgi:hypothetical protein